MAKEWNELFYSVAVCAIGGALIGVLIDDSSYQPWLGVLVGGVGGVFVGVAVGQYRGSL